MKTERGRKNRMLPRYQRNLDSITAEEARILGTKKIAVVGCGGLGGYVIEFLCRIGVGTIVAADGDNFDETNLNRQLLADSESIGKNKAITAKARAWLVNPALDFIAVPARIDEINGLALLRGCDVIIDAVDGVASRLALQHLAEKLGVPLVHGAVAGWHGQVATLFPGDRIIDSLYHTGMAGASPEPARPVSNLSFGPALIGSLEAAEAIKVLIRKKSILRSRLLLVDLLGFEFRTIGL